MTDDLASLHVRDLPGVFAARRLGRELAAGLGLEQQDQVRVATALSEVSRSAITTGQSAMVVFGAGLILSTPAVRQYLGGLNIGNLVGGIIPKDFQRYMRMRSM